MKTRYLYFSAGFVLGILILILLGHSQILNNNTLNDFPQGYKIITPEIPEKLDFAGDRIPLENFEVRERIEREFLVNTYWHSSTLLNIKKANRWFPVIEPILKKNNIPDDFKYIAVIESNLSNVISPAGATGYWQFMEAAALKYGLEVNSQVDERYNVEKSTEAACKYINEAYLYFGNWTLAAASYNMGVSGIQKQLSKQKAFNYYNLVLSEETSRYIARIIAVKEIMNNPAKYGFLIEPDELYSPYQTYDVTLTASIDNLADFALEKGINYKTLKYFNPWLRDNFIKVKPGKSYTLKFPEEGSITLIKDTH